MATREVGPPCPRSCIERTQQLSWMDIESLSLQNLSKGGTNHKKKIREMLRVQCDPSCCALQLLPGHIY